MEFGLTWAKLDEMEYVTEAERLGFTHLWATDSALIRSDAFVFLTVAAQKTSTMKLGVGVAVPGLRLAPTLAGAMATLNMLAPGRCFVALGTGTYGTRKDFSLAALTAAGEPDRLARVSGRIPMGRPATAEEVAQAVLWLLSDAALYVTGTVIKVAGGL